MGDVSWLLLPRSAAAGARRVRRDLACCDEMNHQALSPLSVAHTCRPCVAFGSSTGPRLHRLLLYCDSSTVSLSYLLSSYHAPTSSLANENTQHHFFRHPRVLWLPLCL